MAGESPSWFGRYLLLESIGKGGFGSVHLAVRAGEDELVVLKMLRPELLENEEVLGRFRHEIEISRRLAGKSFARVFEAGAVGEIPYLVMEYVEGCTLRKLLNRVLEQSGQLALEEAVQFSRGLLSAVESLHAIDLDIVHRDLAPTNLIVTQERDIRLIDLGVGRSALKEVETRTGAVVGSPGYLSPEQVRGRAFDQRSDQFACALLVWELFSGDRLIPRGPMAAVLAATAKLEYRPLREVRLAIPEALDDVLRMALSRKPESRFESVGALRRALIPVFASLPKSEAHAIRFDDVYEPTHSEEQLESLRARAREMSDGPHDEPTIFASFSISDSMVEMIEPADTIPLMEMPKPVRAPPRKVPWPAGSYLLGALLVVGGGLLLGIRLGQQDPEPIRATPEQIVIPPPVRVSARPHLAPIDLEATPEPEVIPEAPPVRELVRPARKVVHLEPKSSTPPPPRPPPSPDYDALLARATILRDRAPALRGEIDAVLSDLALEGKRRDPERLDQIELRLRNLELRYE